MQAFELDDFHSESPIHSSSVVLPALFALAQHISSPVSGKEFLLAALVGYEVGPRVGFGLRGGEILSRGWHSGAVFGPAAAALASSKLLGLNVDTIEDALGIACTQACGLMSAQYGSMVKRMQHGFASRNGLFSAIMASQNYTGIKKVLEVPYGGYISTFGNGAKREPSTTPHRITEHLGQDWELQNINVKPYASMGATHATIDCIRKIQEERPHALSNIELVHEIIVEMSEPAYKKGGWTPTRPVEPTSAQISAPYAAACQIVDSAVLVEQFAPMSLDRDEIWDWVSKIRCVHNSDFNQDKETMWFQRMTIKFKDSEREEVKAFVKAPRGVKPLLTNEEIREKWITLTREVIDETTQASIENLVLSIEDQVDPGELVALLAQQTEKLRGF